MRLCPLLYLALLLAALLLGCSNTDVAQTPTLRFWHTFNTSESELLQAWLAKPESPSVATTILPFAQATTRFRNALEQGQCPDLLRIDATRIPGLVATNTIAKVPEAIWKERDWLPEAEHLVRFEREVYGIPQSLDGLALIRRRASTPWPPQQFSLWLQEARRTQPHPRLGLLIDGYWFVAFLRGAGAALPNAAGRPEVNSAEARNGLQAFASLFQEGLAMDLLDERTPARAMTRAFRQGTLAEVFTGPWHLPELSGGDLDSLQAGAFPGGTAPRGGQVLVVPRCAKSPNGAWRLAHALTEPALQSQWALQQGSIPVTTQGLRAGGRLVNEFYNALQAGRPLPRHHRVPELFDDLTPAVVAVVSGDASAQEALAGVSRAWARLYKPSQATGATTAIGVKDEP